MPQNGTTTTVISLGGSLMVPNGVDAAFIKEFTDLITSYTHEGKRFFIITGGGHTCRYYQQALRDMGCTDTDSLDWMGIYITRVNAHLLRVAFGELAYENIVTDPTEPIATDKQVIIGAGWKPGWSTDYVAVMVAKQMNATTVLNLSNIEYVYDKDPHQFDDAKQIEQMSWAQYRTMVPEEWNPGLHAPLDPIAAKEAEAMDLSVGVLNGKIENIKRYFNNEPFIGTLIS